MKRVAIIGGGISGLSAAYGLEGARAAGALEYKLWEAGPRLGGVLVTERVEGCLVEAGPDSFLSEKAWGLDFCRNAGLGDQLIGSNDAERKTYILVKGRLVPIPDGLQFMVPTKILPTLTSPLFSLSTKLRMAEEYFQRPNSRHPASEESVARMVERHFGEEMVERLADPLLAGVYGGEASKLSVAAVLPRFVQMEQQHGSLGRAVLAARRRRALAAERDPAWRAAAPPPLFTSLKEGMQQLVDAIVPQIPGEAIRLSAPVSRLEWERNGWVVSAAGRESEKFDCVILAVPAFVAGALLAQASPELAATLGEIPYSSSVTVVLGYDRSALAPLPAGFGFLVPRSEGKRMMACTFVHNKFPHRAPPDKGLLRVFLGGSRDEAVLALSDREMLTLVHEELRQILRLDAEPRFTRVYRWKKSMAQYTVGHPQRTQRIEQLVEALPNLRLAGNAYRGIGVPDCIASGLLAASQTLAGLGSAFPSAWRRGRPSPHSLLRE